MLLKGDVDGNGTIDIDDPLLIQLYVFGKVSLTDEQIEAADILRDTSKKVNTADAYAIQRHINGLSVINGDKFYS